MRRPSLSFLLCAYVNLFFCFDSPTLPCLTVRPRSLSLSLPRSCNSPLIFFFLSLVCFSFQSVSLFSSVVALFVLSLLRLFPSHVFGWLCLCPLSSSDFYICLILYVEWIYCKYAPHLHFSLTSTSVWRRVTFKTMFFIEARWIWDKLWKQSERENVIIDALACLSLK